ncbi:MAG: hypothetical protein A2848_02575 [Candidatus Magasanikbacteria bacterium RIFCSPHIGHO2_01_FULL_50_8]|uniref:Uncharacterized protein n=1 Tax=Candidatus Magasanikbacteria bacterium RIFCSPHIGHO2_01_FULL_50_8 TaxID=1798674 RepID=A0A1F6LVU8_9BACT|nr:MAG: hypothetical protein A2848_02575 [Candidatus Magasanikbacteria bacterium RIFCSPHIGHO2_01_FULL_50_8]
MTKSAAEHPRQRPSFAQFRERLHVYAEKDYPDYLDGVNETSCAAYYPPNPKVMMECHELLIEYTPVVFKYMCLQRALKTIVAGELCRAPRHALEEAAYVAAGYAHLIAEKVPPLPTRPQPGLHRLTAAEIARRYLSAHHAHAYALIVFNTLSERYAELRCDGDHVAAREVSDSMIKFAYEYLGIAEIERARELKRHEACNK